MSKIDYDLKKIKGIAFDVDGVLSPATVPIDSDGNPRRMANIKDGYAMVQALRHGLKLAIISGADTEPVRKRFELIGFNDIYLGHIEKLPVLCSWMEEKGPSPEQVAYCGDDIPDILPMVHVGLPVAPRDADPDVKAVARFISTVNGGCGVARELIEEVMKTQGTWPAADKRAYGK